jgi:hypothetical protein
MEPELSLQEQFRLVPYINPKTGAEVVIGSPEYNILVKKYGEPNKIKSPKSNVLIGVGKGAYVQLLKEGYSNKELILGINVNKTNKELIPIDFHLPDDIMVEIYNNARIYDKLTLCKLNKNLNNLHQRITKSRSDFYIYAIHNNKLYITNKHMPEIPLPKVIVPISIAATQKSIILLTQDGELYGKGYNTYGELGNYGKYYKEFDKMPKPPGTIIQVYCKHYQTVVLTTEGIFTYGNENVKLRTDSYTKILSNNNIYLMYPYAIDDEIRFATPEGLFIMNGKRIKKINIDGINDIIIIHMSYILTTTGLYRVVMRKKLEITKMPIDNVKKISMGDVLTVLTYENEIYKEQFFKNKFTKLTHKDVNDMHGDGVLITNGDIKIVTDMSGYFT